MTTKADAPAIGIADGGAGRQAEDVGDRDAADEQRERGAAPLRRARVETATLATPKNTPWPQAEISRAPSSSS